MDITKMVNNWEGKQK